MCKRFALIAGFLLTLAGAASADPVVLRPPSALDLDFEGNGFFFVGDGFTAQQDLESTIGVFFGGSFSGCDPCRAGETYDPSYTTTNAFMGNGTATVGGTTYSNVAFFGDIDFDVTPQPFPDTDADFFRLQTPFTFTGALRGFVDSQLAFSVGLTGVGLTDRFWDNNQDGRFFAGEETLRFVFTDPAAATPEPASLLLLGTGLAGLVARARRAHPRRTRSAFVSSAALAALSAVAWLSGAAPAAADTIYSNLGPGGTFSTSSLPTRETESPEIPTFHIWWGAPFTPTVSGTLSAVELPLDYQPDGTGSLFVDVRSSIGGLPGASFDSYAITGTTPQPAALIRFTSLLRPTLTAGTTYFVTVGTTGSDNNLANWYASPVMAEGLMATAGERNGPYAEALTLPLGLRVEADPLAATPEPASFLLLGTGAAGLAARARRRRGAATARGSSE